MNKKKLPSISIESVGTTGEENIDSIVRLEPILAWLGYKANDDSMNFEVQDQYYLKPNCPLYADTSDDDRALAYYAIGFGEKEFMADQEKEIIEYVLNYRA